MAAKVDNVMIENATLLRGGFMNFSGRETQYNREGDRNFHVALPKDLADDMLADGWNVKYLTPRDEGDEPQAHIVVSVSFKGQRSPRCVLVKTGGQISITEGEVGILDWAELSNVDLILRPYAWEVNGKTGIKAYLHSIYATIAETELDVKYADTPVISRGPVQKQIGGSASSDDEIVDAELIDDVPWK